MIYYYSQYLERRFSVGVRMVGCVFFILEYVSNGIPVEYLDSGELGLVTIQLMDIIAFFFEQTLYLFVVLYAPSLALEAGKLSLFSLC